MWYVNTIYSLTEMDSFFKKTSSALMKCKSTEHLDAMGSKEAITINFSP